jgi:hypothetical protein
LRIRSEQKYSEEVIAMTTRISPDHSTSSDIAPEIIKNAGDELSRRLGQPVTMVLGDGIVAVRAEGELFAGESVVVMDAGPLLPRKRAAEWADAFERKISRLSKRAADVEHLYAEIAKSPSPEKTGAIVLEHAGDYDDDFFEALATVIAHDKARLRLRRVCNFQALRAYLQLVRRRARAGEMAAMRTELAQGAAQDRDLGRGQGLAFPARR